MSTDSTTPTNAPADDAPETSPAANATTDDAPVGKFLFVIDYDLYYQNNATELKQIGVRADNEQQAFERASKELAKIEGLAGWRYRGTFKKVE